MSLEDVFYDHDEHDHTSVTGVCAECFAAGLDAAGRVLLELEETGQTAGLIRDLKFANAARKAP